MHRPRLVVSLSACPLFSLSPPAHSFFIGPTVINIHTCTWLASPRERERERERESFIRNNLHNGVVSGAARGQALRGPMWAGLTPDSKGDPTGDTGGLIAADRRHHTCLRDAREHCRPLQAARQVPGKKN